MTKALRMSMNTPTPIAVSNPPSRHSVEVMYGGKSPRIRTRQKAKSKKRR